tara:strand:+ start:609 stop:1487 length:879 start_codon:yes stop_codon:yes gene_type:complete
MDYHALQHKLFEMDPSDPAEDIRKLTEMASGEASVGSKDTEVNHLEASVADIPEGSAPIDRDYSINDFAKLAGVQLNEEVTINWHAAADKVKSGVKKGYQAAKSGAKAAKSGVKTAVDGAKAGYKDPNKITPAFKAGKDAYKSVSDKPKDNNTDDKKIEPQKGISKDKKQRGFSKQEENIITDINQAQLVEELSKQIDEILPALAGMAARGLATKAVGSAVDKLTANKKNKQKPIKARDPNSQYMNDLRKSGAQGAHKDKKRDAKMGITKHKKDYTNESIKAQLWAALNQKK